MKRSDDWWHALLEMNAVFGIYLNTLENKNKRYLVLKPYIMIQTKDADVIRYIHDSLSLNTKITDKKHPRQSVIKAIRLQRIDDIDKILSLLDGYRFVAKRKQEVFDRFIKAYERIKQIGAIWHDWDPEIGRFIDDCLPIHQNNRGFTNEEWKSNIKAHFNEQEEKAVQGQHLGQDSTRADSTTANTNIHEKG